MVPRTRANFSLGDLSDAARAREKTSSYRARVAEQLCRYLGVEHVLLTPSGRCGLYAILKALGRPRVVLPAYTCNAVVEAAMLAGKTIEYAEVERDGFNVDVDLLSALLGPDAVFVATHQFGIPCDITRIVTMCRERGALVVEDAAASLGARTGGRLTGTFADAAFFSFDISKLVTVPLKGGAVVANDAALFARIVDAYRAEIEPMPTRVKARLLAMAATLLGIQGPRRYRLFHTLKFQRTGTFTAESPVLHAERTPFYRYDFTEWQALIAMRQLERIDELVSRRRALYAEYEQRLRGCAAFRTPPSDASGEWAPIRFPIRVAGDKLAFYREANRRGVDFAFSFTHIAAPPSFTRAHELARSVLDIPFFADLTRAEIEKTVSVLLAQGDRVRPPC